MNRITKQTERKAMGLAASQARFLAITSRKANCEFQSMQIAQNKLSITRELAQVSDDYQNALNKTTLVWDYDGSGENTYDLSYGVLMTPTVLNNFNPYLITTRTGSVVLNGQMAQAAAKISSDGAPVSRSAAGFAEFMKALGESGVVAQSTAAAITNLTDLHYVDSAGKEYTNPSFEEIQENGYRLTATKPGNNDIVYANGYNKDAGYGSEPLSKNGAIANNIVGLAYRLQDVNVGELFTSNPDYTGKLKFIVDGTELSAEEQKKLTLSDLLTKNVVVIEQYQDDKHGYVGIGTGTGNAATQTDGLSNFIAKIDKSFKEILGADLVSQRACNNAQYLLKNKYDQVTNISADKISDTASWNRAIENINNNSIVFVQNSGSKQNSTAAVNLSNLVASYLTYFELSLNGYDSSYSVGPTPNTSYFVTSDPMYNYVMKDSNSVTNDTVMKADFYMQLYNNICINGWTQSSGDIEDNDYLEQMLKNGNYFITSLNEDGYFYQGRYNEGDCIIEVKDEDAIAQAEAEFSSKKAKLTYKEEQLDLNMKNLDAEISSLTTEYDSVKNLISKNVEKVFTMFQ